MAFALAFLGGVGLVDAQMILWGDKSQLKGEEIFLAKMWTVLSGIPLIIAVGMLLWLSDSRFYLAIVGLGLLGLVTLAAK